MTMIILKPERWRGESEPRYVGLPTYYVGLASSYVARPS